MLKDVIKVIKDEIGKKSKIISKIAVMPAAATSSPFAIELEIKSCVDKRLVAAFTTFAAESATQMGFELTRGPAALQPAYERWTVLSSPFVHKTARTQFERRTHGRAMRIEGIWREEVGAKYIWYLNRHVPNEIELSIKLHERHSI